MVSPSYPKIAVFLRSPFFPGQHGLANVNTSVVDKIYFNDFFANCFQNAGKPKNQAGYFEYDPDATVCWYSEKEYSTMIISLHSPGADKPKALSFR